MYCTSCGNAIADGASFCTSCGAPVGAQANASVQPVPSATNRAGRPWLAIALAIGLVILVLGALWVNFGPIGGMEGRSGGAYDQAVFSAPVGSTVAFGTYEQNGEVDLEHVELVRGLSFFFAAFRYMSVAFMAVVLASMIDTATVNFFGLEIPKEIVMSLPLSMQVLISMLTSFLSGLLKGDDVRRAGDVRRDAAVRLRQGADPVHPGADGGGRRPGLREDGHRHLRGGGILRARHEHLHGERERVHHRGLLLRGVRGRAAGRRIRLLRGVHRDDGDGRGRIPADLLLRDGRDPGAEGRAGRGGEKEDRLRRPLHLLHPVHRDPVQLHHDVCGLLLPGVRGGQEREPGNDRRGDAALRHGDGVYRHVDLQCCCARACWCWR